MGDFSKLNGYDVKDAVARTLINDMVNVKSFGVKGDGTNDDYQAIQDCINNNPGCEIFIPNGTYIISQPLLIPSTDALKVSIKLQDNATIKASDDFVGEFLILLGGSGTKEILSNSKHKIGIDGGIIDCNGRCNGVYLGNVHFGKIQNIRILNATDIGIQLDKSDNNSGDAYVENVDISGYDTDNTDGIGVYITSTDNNLKMVRTDKFHIGFHVVNSANYLSDCHPLYSTLDSETFATSIGFKLENHDQSLINCYADNFGNAIETDGGRFYAFNFYAYWFDVNGFDHTIIKCNTRYFRGYIDGLTIYFPETGNNYGLVIAEDGYTYPVYDTTFNGNIQSGKIDNLHLTETYWMRMTNKFTDPLLTSNILVNNKLYQGGYSDTVEQDKYYPVLYIPAMGVTGNFTSEITNANIKFSNVFNVNLRFQIINDVLRIYETDTLLNSSGFGYTFALAKPAFAGNAYILYIKFDATPTDNNKIFEVSLIDPSYNNRMAIIPRGAKYNIADLNGVTTPDNLLSTSEPIKNQNAYTGIIEHQTEWATEHKILVKNPITSNSNPVLFFIIWGSNVGVYSFFAGKFMPLNTDNVDIGASCAANYNGTTGYLTITTNQTSMIYSIKI